jgi:hypothetical protein
LLLWAYLLFWWVLLHIAFKISSLPLTTHTCQQPYHFWK